MIPKYWMNRKHEWLDEHLNRTDNWNEATFVKEGGEIVRIVKRGDVYDQLHKTTRGQ
jgi:hypothetical protein